MTQEEKLKTLLQVAIVNGYRDKKEIVTIEFIDGNYIQYINSMYERRKYSINDLVTNWEEGEVSFIEALCNSKFAVVMTFEDYYENHKEFPNLNCSDSIRFSWTLQPTYSRLAFLFDTFDELLK